MLGKYELNKIYNEDSYKAIKDIPDNSVDLIVTDPPYLINNTNAGGNSTLSSSIQKMNDELLDRKLTNGITNEMLEEMYRVMKKPNIYIWCNHKQIPQYINFFVNEKGCNFDILIWNKTNAMPLFSNKYLTDKEYCLYFRKGGYCNPENYEDAKTIMEAPINIHDKKKYKHPTIKPLQFIKKLILNSSLEGQLIFDPFIGSGTTAVASKELGRNFLGFDIEKKWNDIANDRVNGIDPNGQTSIFTDFENIGGLR